MHEWVIHIHHQTWIAQFINIIRALSKQWGMCDKSINVLWAKNVYIDAILDAYCRWFSLFFLSWIEFHHIQIWKPILGFVRRNGMFACNYSMPTTIVTTFFHSIFLTISRINHEYNFRNKIAKTHYSKIIETKFCSAWQNMLISIATRLQLVVINYQIYVHDTLLAQNVFRYVINLYASKQNYSLAFKWRCAYQFDTLISYWNIGTCFRSRRIRVIRFIYKNCLINTPQFWKGRCEHVIVILFQRLYNFYKSNKGCLLYLYDGFLLTQCITLWGTSKSSFIKV